MNEDITGLNIVQIAKLPGVLDLPIKVRGPFAQALRAEAAGEKARAEEYLNKAVAAEGGVA